jgi:cytochrome P450
MRIIFMRNRGYYCQTATNFAYQAISVVPKYAYEGVSFLFSLGASILSPITTPIYARAERFAVGDMRELFRDQTGFKKKLMAQARESSNGLVVHQFGKFGGNLVVVIPQSQMQFDYLLNTFDSQPKGRSSRESLQYFSGSNRFIISNTDAGAVHQRQELGAFLKPSNFMTAVVEETAKSFGSEVKGDRPVRKTFSLLTRSIMLRVLMGVETLPPGTYETMQGYAENSKKWMGFPFPTLFKMLPSSRQYRKQYKALGQTILQSLLDNIMHVLKTHSSPEKINVVFATLINLIKEKHPELNNQEKLSNYLKIIPRSEVQKYLNHDALTVIPYLLRAADNLTDALKTFLIELAKAPEKAEKLFREITSASGSSDKFEWDTLKRLPYLDAWYKESLRCDGSNSVSRYAQFPTPLTDSKNEDRVIPANSMVLFDLLAVKRGKTWEEADQFKPERFLGKDFQMHQFPLVFFSAGRRKCPASFVVEYVFKLIAKLTIESFEVELTATEKDKEQFALTPRSKKVAPEATLRA